MPADPPGGPAAGSSRPPAGVPSAASSDAVGGLRLERLSADQVRELGPEATAECLRALTPATESVEATVHEIIQSVRAGGDGALAELILRFDTRGTPPAPLRVSPDELDAAIKSLPLDVVAGLQVAISNVAEVAEAGVTGDRRVQLPQGHHVLVREIPVASAAVYVPGGRAPYPSTVVMGVVTARAAGVLDVCVCAPPGSHGDVHPAILGTCRLLGVDTVLRMGGAHAIAALALGTESIPRVDVIVGPGNLYVQEAKRQLSHIVGIDGFAGPSDLLVVMGDDADVGLVALDLLAQAEHGPDSPVIAVSATPARLDALAGELARVSAAHPGLEPSCALVATDDLRVALTVANAFAPEHLELVGAEAEALASLVRTAGCLFVGPTGATAFGDYVAGSNHVLPTGGAARFGSSLSPVHFRRRMPEVHIGRAAAKLAAAGAPVARAEGFELHAQSMEARASAGPAADRELGENGTTP